MDLAGRPQYIIIIDGSVGLRQLQIDPGLIQLALGVDPVRRSRQVVLELGFQDPFVLRRLLDGHLQDFNIFQ